MTKCHNEVFLCALCRRAEERVVERGGYSHSMVEGGFEEMS